METDVQTFFSQTLLQKKTVLLGCKQFSILCEILWWRLHLTMLPLLTDCWLEEFSCYICQIDLWSWSYTVHIRCTWPATACLRNKPTDHINKFTFFILLHKKRVAINELLVGSNDMRQVLLFTCIVYMQYALVIDDRPSRVSPFSFCMCVRAGPCVW